MSGFVKIWDPYFGHKDAFTFLFYVTDPSMPISVLTSFDATEEERSTFQVAPPTAGASLLDWKRQKMADVLKHLREPRAGTPGLTALRVRSGAAAFHDRFIITSGHCWQLGCSFNQIGGVMSTIVEFPYPAMIEREFDIAWKRAKDV